MKAIRILTAALAMAALMSCQDSGQIRDNLENGRTRTIEFSNYVGSHTRTSKKTGNSFVAGDVMAVWGDQITGSDYEEIFNGQQVSYVSGDTWTYANKRLWNPGSDYTFYAVFPYMEDPLYEISSYEEGRLFKIKNYQVPEAGTDQIDIMISERRPVSPYDKVDMIFHHMLTKIDFIFRVSGDFNLLGIAYVELTKFHIEGIKKSGTFIQTAWSDDNLPVGYWENGTDLLEIPDIKGVRSDDLEIRHVLEDYLLVPQTLDDKIKFSAEFKIHYNDSTSCVITRDSIVLASLTGKDKEGGTTSIRNWETNTSYVYQLVFNPGKNEHGGDSSQPNGSISTDGNSIADIDVSVDGSGVYWVDEDRDGEPDYPLVWADPDGDGTENLYPDRNGDGEPDDPSAGHLWVDRDGDGTAETEVSRTAEKPNTDLPSTEPTPNASISADPDAEADIYVTVDEDGTYWVDEDLDGRPDYQLVWADPDGDGIENLYPDKDGDGKPDSTAADLWVDTDGDGKADTEMSRTAPGKPNTDIPSYPEGTPNASISADKDSPADIIVTLDEDGTYWVDEDLDGKPDYQLVWADPDGDGIENLYPDKDGDGKPDSTAADLWVDTDGDGKADKEVSRQGPGKPDIDVPSTEPEPNACISNTANSAVNIYATVDKYGVYWADEDLDGTNDCYLVWADPDGDGYETLFPDRNKDSKPDNVGGGDLWVDTDGDGLAETEVRRKAPEEHGTDIPTYTNTIEFSATAYDWEAESVQDVNIGDLK